MPTPFDDFHSDGYKQHNTARLEHLATYLPVQPLEYTVLELGAGIGDHTAWWLSMGATVTAVEGRTENAAVLRERFPQVEVIESDLRVWQPTNRYDVVYAYGVLYHLPQPEIALATWSEACRSLFLLETCVSPVFAAEVNIITEGESYSAALDGHGCRPTRSWVMLELQKHFRYVYMPTTQPRHVEFPTDWTVQSVRPQEGLVRAVFVGSRKRLVQENLTSDLLSHQTYANTQSRHHEAGDQDFNQQVG